MIGTLPVCCPGQPFEPHAAGQPAWLLGWEKRPAAIGFQTVVQSQGDRHRPIIYQGDGHILTCAPTGSGKFLSTVGPALSEFPGQGTLLVLDPKAECFHVWARRRREIGQRVILLDPFHKVQSAGDCLNPLDLFKLPGALLDSDSEMLASCLSEGHEFTTDRYWTDTSLGLVSGLLRYHLSLPAEQHTFDALRKFIYQDDLNYRMAVALDQNAVPLGLARDEFVSYLETPEDKTRPCVLSTARTFLKSLGGEEAAELLGKSTFPLQDVYEGKPLAIFIVFPSDKVSSHKNLLRLILQVLLTAIGRRPEIPEHPTLILLDEAASLGDLPALRQALTMFRGVGVVVHSVWQDLSQIRLAYPRDWETIINNCGVMQCFNLHNHLLAASWSAILGCSPHELVSMPEDEEALFIQGRGLVRARRLNYLRDPFFNGKFDVNPLYARVQRIKDPTTPER